MYLQTSSWAAPTLERLKVSTGQARSLQLMETRLWGFLCRFTAGLLIVFRGWERQGNETTQGKESQNTRWK